MSATTHTRIIWIDYVKAMAITIVVLLTLVFLIRFEP